MDIKGEKQISESDPDPVILTFATHPDGYLNALQQGAQQAQISLRVLGFGQKFQGFGWMRRQLGNEVARICESNPKQLLVLADAYDVLMSPMCTAKDLKERFLSFHADIVISTEGFGRNPVQNVLAKFVFGQCMGTYLNSGLIAGTAEKLVSLFDIWNAVEQRAHENNDQLTLSRTCRKHENWFQTHVKLDMEMRMFATSTCFTAKHQFGELLAKRQSSELPLFYHGNGNCDMRDLALLFGYDTMHVNPRASYSLAVVKHYGGLFWNRVKYAVAFVVLVVFVLTLPYESNWFNATAECLAGT